MKLNKIFITLSTLFFVSGCSFINETNQTPTEKKEGHEHIFVIKPAVEPTCEKMGNKKYLYCADCGCYFNEKKEAIKKSDFEIAPLGHNFDHIEVSGAFKKDYYPGDEFDASGMIVNKVCGREGCDKKEIVTDYIFNYENASKNVFSIDDTKIIVEVDSLQCDVQITVNHKANSISGMLDEYSLHCNEKVDTSGISAISGNVLFKYFSDSNLTNEVDENTLVGDNTFYLKAYTNVTDLDFENVSKVAKVRVSHKLVYDEVTKIGFMPGKCSKCSYAVKKVMSTDDVLLDSVSKYGMNAHSLTNGANEGNGGLINSPCWAVGESVDSVKISLPLVNYKLYSEVQFEYKTSGKSGAPISIGAIQPSDLLDLKERSNYPGGKIVVKHLKSKINVSVISNDGETKTKVYSNSEISNGNKPINIIFTSSLHRSFYLNKVILSVLPTLPEFTQKIDGIDAPNYENGNGIQITAYNTPRLTSNNYETVLSDLKNAGFTKILPLLDGRSSQETPFINALVNYLNADSSTKADKLTTLFDRIDDLCNSTMSSNIFNIQKCNQYEILYSSFNVGIYDLFANLKNLSATITPADYKLILSRFFANMNYVKNEYCAGISINDEPTSDQMDIVKEGIKAYFEAGLSGEPYVNLLPLNGTSTSSKYVSDYMSKIYPLVNYVSFDNYPLIEGSSIESTHLYNLASYSKAIQNADTNGELRTYLHSYNSTESSHSATTNENALLFQANSAIAFGSRDIAYYSYSSEKDTTEITNCLVNSSTCEKSNLYYLAQNANEKISNIGKVIGSFNYKGTMKYGSCTQMNKVSTWLSSFGDIYNISSSSSPLLVGCYSNGEHDGYFLTNYSDPRSTTTSSTMSVRLNEDYNYALIYKDNEKHVEKINNNKITVSLASGNAAFVIPFYA